MLNVSVRPQPAAVAAVSRFLALRGRTDRRWQQTSDGLSVPKTKFDNNSGEGHPRPAPMRCGHPKVIDGGDIA